MAWPVVFLLYFFLQHVHAYHLKLHGSDATSIDFAASSASQTPGDVALSNKADVSYYADIFVGNQSFTVLVDTGSSDLWIAGTVAKSTPVGQNSSIKYAASSVTGSVRRSEVQFAGQQIMNQAYLQIEPDEENPEGYGILGLGPGSGSFITQDLPLGSGETLLNRLFALDPENGNYFTLLLGRHKDPTTFFQGTVTVGEVIPDYAAILDKPHLPITLVVQTDSVDQHLQVLLDADGIIGPDGKAIPIQTLVEQTANKHQATVVLDSGFTFPQFPREIVDLIYGRFEQSEFLEVPGFGGVYVLPCEQEVNLTLKFAGQLYPIHPLDMTFEPTSVNLSAIQTADGQNACIGTFQPFTYSRRRDPSYDIVLGMSFLRNVYSFYDCGKFTHNSTSGKDPYVQLLSITDPAEAHQDFVTVRLGGIDTTADRKLKAITTKSSKSKTVVYVVAGVVGGLVASAIVLFFVLRSRRRR